MEDDYYTCPICREPQIGNHDCTGKPVIADDSLAGLNQRYRELNGDKLVRVKNPQPLLIITKIYASPLSNRCFYCSHSYTEGETLYLCDWVEDALDMRANLCFDCVNFISTGETYQVTDEQRKRYNKW